MFYHMRCGILVSIRGGVVRQFSPFANVHYENTWSQKISFPEGSLAAYTHAKSAALKRRPESLLPPSAWWMNGGIVCNVMPEEVWGDAHCAELLDMIRQTCATHPVPDCDFFINKRDYPHLKRDGSEPYSRFFGDGPLLRERYSSYAPIFSFYTGHDFADVTIPLTEDWKLAGTGDVTPPPWDAAVAVAIFRGTATGNGISPDTNVRLRLAVHGVRHPGYVDAGIVSYNQRDKVVGVQADGTVLIDFLKPCMHSLPPLVPWMTLAEQAKRHKYILYADGHCAASRYGALMKSGRTILRVESDRKGDGGHMWLFDHVISAVVEDDREDVPPDADHFLIRSDLRNLNETIDYLRANDSVAQAVAGNAMTKSPTKAAILEAWRLAMSSVPRVAERPPPGTKMWFSPYDARYAVLHRGDTSNRVFSTKL